MFAYRHAFHVGNHADVFKHSVVLHILDYLQQKPGPLQIIDTHGGAGAYALDTKMVRDKAEYRTGVGRLLPMKPEGLPPMIAHYLEMHRNATARVASAMQTPVDSTLVGSPLLLAEAMRPADHLRTFELHPSDAPLLEAALRPFGRKAKSEKADGFQALKRLLPPVSRRGLVLIDPPYEMKNDYAKTSKALREALERFSTGCFVVWIPMVQRFEVGQLLRSLGPLAANFKVEVLVASLKVRSPLADGLGLMGSHLAIINPPYGLEASLRSTLPWLVKQLGQDKSAGFELGPPPAPIHRKVMERR